MSKIQIDPTIDHALALGAKAYLSISGGKDSQAIAMRLAHIAHGCLHMDLGRAEWPQTPAFVERIAKEAGLPLHVIRRHQGDLVQEIGERMAKLHGTGKPFWPSAAQRYCTADHKRSQADKFFRHHDLVISIEGIRADESPKRARDLPLSIRKQITAKCLRDLDPAKALAKWEAERPGRLALTWYPIHGWNIDQVWEACGTSAQALELLREVYRNGDKELAFSEWPCHPAYVMGNERVSCAICVLASENDIRNGATNHPWLADIYLSYERKSGFTFRHKRSLSEIIQGS
ncbi:MAG TPA: phosphoadenosine phosphosulfate reductase family protein [Myxococcota bacterium]|nr:phosphoadenosine phosphosulfate reductase family protein [Myxococcota bacterium]HRV17886.1 phosphoadenosine phosphosulfate reductase family protein [Myxococcota bacterium]